MKGIFAVLALGLTSVVATNNPYAPPEYTVHHTTFVTVTECPLTKTKYQDGTTQVYTEMTTSTITVTSCIDCEGVTTIPGPTGAATTTTEVLVTYTTVCPVTETITEPGNTYTVTKTTTSTVVTSIPTTIIEKVHGPEETTSVYEGYTTTVTSLCPITETKTLDGDMKTITYTSTSTYVTVVPTVIQETTQLPESTTKVIEGFTVTSTSLCPITETQTIGGQVHTVTYTSTSTFITVVPTKIQETLQLPESTTKVTEGFTVTSTSLCPITETTTIGGQVHTVTYTSTSTYVTVVPTKIEETIHLPESTSAIYEGVTITSTSLCPITETKTIGGEVTYITYTSTSVFEAVIPTTIHTYVEGPDSTSKVYEEITLTKTNLIPVTETKTKEGNVETYTYTKTSVYETHIPTTLHEYTTLAPQTSEVITYISKTSTEYVPVTKIQTVSGHEVTIVHTSVSLIVVQQPSTIHQQTTLMPHTQEIVSYVNKTSTEYIPVTKVKTISGEELTLVHTKTSLVVDRQPTTIVQTSLFLTTEYATSFVYETIKTIETDSTTVSAGSTIVVPTTLKSTILVTEEYLITKTLEAPTSIETHIEATTVDTVIPIITEIMGTPEESDVTIHSTYYNTIPTSVQTAYTHAPANHSIVLATGGPRQSAPAQFTGAANANGAKPFAMAVAAGVWFALA